MSLRGITVCVNYSDLLARSIEAWHVGLDRLIVVTSSADKKTQELCKFHNVEMHITDIFYENGASFNKGAALSEAIIVKKLREEHADWILVFDADIVPPTDWRDQLSQYQLTPGVLYGAFRYWVHETGRLVVNKYRRMPQGWVLGFFTMFHSSDQHLPKSLMEPVFDICWPHAGNYDTIFCRLWERKDQIILPIPMIHLGEERQNWMGRDKKEDLKATLSLRKSHEDWMREKMPQPPTLNVTR